MSPPVVAIGIDGPNSEHFQAWCDAGLLPNISRTGESGVVCRYTHTKRYRNEQCWNTVLSGRELGAAGALFNADNYDFYNTSLQRSDTFKPFYELGSRYRVCTFDFPGPILPRLNGLQVSGWGSELNASRPMSWPPELLGELEKTYGADPKLDSSLQVVDYQSGEIERSYSVPSIYDLQALQAFKAKLLTAIERRTNICLDLLQRQNWDLFLAVFTESHTANHALWHLCEPHPAVAPQVSFENVLLELVQSIDTSIGRIARALPPGVNLLVYTIDHTVQNSMDVPSMALLPEWIYRWNYSGKQALAPGDSTQPVPPQRYDYSSHWKQEVWALATDTGRMCLASPDEQQAAGDPLSWNPANWYKGLWSSMRSFALPSVSDGYIRLNVAGRERHGVVSPQDYQAELQALIEALQQTSNPRTGEPAVRRVIRTREAPGDTPEIPPDLIVCWNEKDPLDTLDCPDCGRVGPLPYFRTGGHVAHGTTVTNTLYARGPGIPPGQVARTGVLEDLPATILALMGVHFPDPRATGKTLLSPVITA